MRAGRPDAGDFLPQAMTLESPCDAALRSRLRPWIESEALAAAAHPGDAAPRVGRDHGDAHSHLTTTLRIDGGP